jgi:hypothetical protein
MNVSEMISSLVQSERSLHLRDCDEGRGDCCLEHSEEKSTDHQPSEVVRSGRDGGNGTPYGRKDTVISDSAAEESCHPHLQPNRLKSTHHLTGNLTNANELKG